MAWIGDWWKCCGLACLALRLASDAFKPTCPQSDSYPSDSLTHLAQPLQSHSELLRFIDSFSSTQIHLAPRSSTQSHTNQRRPRICSVSLRFTQSPAISHGFAYTHTDSCSSFQIPSDLPQLAQPSLASLALRQIHPDPFHGTWTNSDSFSFTPTSLCHAHTHSDSIGFAQICSGSSSVQS